MSLFISRGKKLILNSCNVVAISKHIINCRCCTSKVGFGFGLGFNLICVYINMRFMFYKYIIINARLWIIILYRFCLHTRNYSELSSSLHVKVHLLLSPKIFISLYIKQEWKAIKNKLSCRIQLSRSNTQSRLIYHRIYNILK